MATKQDLKEKLDFLGLDIEDLPNFLTKVEPVSFNPSRLNNDKELKVYKYVPIKDIDIYCTPAYRDDPVREKYSKASPLGLYLKKPESGEDFERQKDFFKMLEDFSIEEFYEINDRQNDMNNKIPFKVFYPRNQLWQIYYSEQSNKYFMLVSTKEDTYSEFFYLLKKQIEIDKLSPRSKKRDEKIYVPISYVNYNEEILTNKQINDIENYLWVFTKNWPLVYEVYDKNDEISMQIIGETYVYENLKTTYKVVLKSKIEAERFYKLIKALFILQTEISNRYVFRTQIDNSNALEFTYDDRALTYEDLARFVKEKYLETEKEIKALTKDVYESERKLKIMKEEVKEKEAEYFKKQKEISTYLEYRKTFFGKVKYFFKGGKKKLKDKEQEEENKKELQKLKDDFKKNREERNKKEQEEQELKENINIEKKFYTIDDLVSINKIYEKSHRNINDIKQDIKALELKLINLSKKIENATLYINEIDKHKKSIFDFWKFANKDEVLELEVGNEVQTISREKFKRKFDFESDFGELGITADKNQRVKLSKNELDNLFVSYDSELLPIINMLKAGDMDKDVIEQVFMDLKKEYARTALQGKEESFDVFGSMRDDMTQVKYIGNKSHRENEKDKYQILNINKKIDVFDFTERLQMIVNSLNESLIKIKSVYDMPIYRIIPINDKIHTSGFEFYNINIEKELEQYKHKEESAIKLIKLNIKEEMPLVYMSNIIFFDNINNTLPKGMNLSSKVLIDCDKFDFVLSKKTKFKTNKYFNESNTAGEDPKTVYIYFEEYDVELKQNKVKDIENKDNDKEDNDVLEKDSVKEDIINTKENISIENKDENQNQNQEKTVDNIENSAVLEDEKEEKDKDIDSIIEEEVYGNLEDEGEDDENEDDVEINEETEDSEEEILNTKKKRKLVKK